MEAVLNSREKKAKQIQSLLKVEQVVVSLKANIPGNEKDINEAYILLHIFSGILLNKYPEAKLNVFNSPEGPYCLFTSIGEDPHRLKKVFIEIEETHPLGRFIDFDVHCSDNSLSRSDFGLTNRKCLICEKEAWVCIKERTHNPADLTMIVKDNVHYYVKQVLEEVLVKSFLLELDLEPKFGLVTKSSNGSHQDMNYDIMKSSVFTIVPYLIDMYEVGYSVADVSIAFEKVRSMGKQAEKAMLKNTNGINTYKGAIFLLGVILTSLGALHQSKFSQDLTNIIQKMTSKILNELEGQAKTFGIKAYQEHKFYTARHEVYYGIPSVLEALSFLNRYQNRDQEALMMTLITIISLKNDTVALKRAGSITKYESIVDLISSIKTFDIDQISQVTNICVKENMSFGGSADILIAAIFLDLIVDHLA
ncbi:MAG: triphosphoribosyl-dephospho-CoA synthase [Acholeplasmataceae bacterium]|nr:triphosphoribosyl-dephospho-CoA synthase [Acholeplasmataceae bacterium]